MIQRLHEYKRQTLNILGVIHRYLQLKALTPAERKKTNPKAVFFAGKAAPGCTFHHYGSISGLLTLILRRLHRQADHSSHRQCRPHHQRGQGHQRIPVPILPAGLLRVPRRGAHPVFRYQPAHLHCRYRGVRNVSLLQSNQRLQTLTLDT